MKTLVGHSAGVLCLKEISSDTLVSGFAVLTIKLWCSISGDCLKTLVGHKGCIICLLHLTNENIVSGSLNVKIKIWNL